MKRYLIRLRYDAAWSELRLKPAECSLFDPESHERLLDRMSPGVGSDGRFDPIDDLHTAWTGNKRFLNHQGVENVRQRSLVQSLQGGPEGYPLFGGESGFWPCLYKRIDEQSQFADHSADRFYDPLKTSLTYNDHVDTF
jgi:hypothetical protein